MYFKLMRDLIKKNHWINELMYASSSNNPTFQISDIKDTHIDAPLKDISETMLCDLPEKAPWTVDEFLAKTQVL